MVKPAKLYAQLLLSTRRTVSFRDFVALIQAFGLTEERQKGSHRCFSHPHCHRPLVIQPKGSDAKDYQIKQFLDMIEENGLTLED
jgi:predicted RNA binding protein YcfA (HicA-like mRNA interferase family)